jgi:hypothetical protein
MEYIVHTAAGGCGVAKGQGGGLSASSTYDSRCLVLTGDCIGRLAC